VTNVKKLSVDYEVSRNEVKRNFRKPLTHS